MDLLETPQSGPNDLDILDGTPTLEVLIDSDHDHDEHNSARIPVVQFFVLTGLQVVLFFGLFLWASPSTFHAEMKQPGQVVLWTLLFGLPLSLFEYLYHRYLLHSAVLPFLKSMHRAHSQHHGLTSVKAPVKINEPALLVPVANEYSVEHEHQEESMMFPAYAISIFMAMFLVVLALPVKLMFASQPIITALMIAVTLYYSAYEIWHAIMHLPYDKVWKPLMEHPRIGRTVRHVYGFHLMHHWRPTANLAVVGLWGVAAWDHVFRTHHRPARPPLAGSQVSYNDAKMRKPLWPVATLDRWQAGLYRWSRKVEDACARVFLRRTR